MAAGALNILYESNDNTIPFDLFWTGPDQNVVVEDAEPVYALADDEESGLITAISNTSPPVITSIAHGLTTGDKIVLYGVTGINLNRGVEVTVLTTDTFEVAELDSSAIAAPGDGYPGEGGAWKKLIDGADGLDMTQSTTVPGRYYCQVPGTAAFRYGMTLTAFVWDKNLYQGKYFVAQPVTVQRRKG